jgi:GH18 family chitinase
MGFDGVDLNWEYPGDTTCGGREADKANFGLLVDAIRAAFNAEAASLDLTMAVPVIQGKLRKDTIFRLKQMDLTS